MCNHGMDNACGHGKIDRSPTRKAMAESINLIVYNFRNRPNGGDGNIPAAQYRRQCAALFKLNIQLNLGRNIT